MKKIVLYSLIGFLLLAGGCLDFGNGGAIGEVVTGTVKDQQDGVTVSDATIWLGDENTVTGKDGTFGFTGIEEGTYNLRVEREGYNTYSSSVEVRSSPGILEASNEFDVELHTHV